MNQLPETLASEVVTLRRYRPSDVAGLKQAIEASYDDLRRFLPWAQSPPTDESVAEFVTPAAELFGGEHDANYAITLATDASIVGSCGLMPRIGPRALEVGYWVDSRYTGRRIATTTATLLTDAAFGLSDIDRVEIHCDEANAASAAVARNCGFRLDRIVRDATRTADASGRSMIWVVGRDEWAAGRDRSTRR